MKLRLNFTVRNPHLVGRYFCFCLQDAKGERLPAKVNISSFARPIQSNDEWEGEYDFYEDQDYYEDYGNNEEDDIVGDDYYEDPDNSQFPEDYNDYYDREEEDFVDDQERYYDEDPDASQFPEDYNDYNDREADDIPDDFDYDCYNNHDAEYKEYDLY